MTDIPHHRLPIESIAHLTHDVRSYRLPRPTGYEFQPGQATEVSVDRDGWSGEKRPFTFTSLPDDGWLEFTIKSYPDHDGVTELIGQLNVGDHLLIDEPWGAITDTGPGVFIAGGAGVTPFLSILRRRYRDDDLEGCTLLFSNRTEADIVGRAEFEDMPDLTTLFVVTDEPSSDLSGPRFSYEVLEDLITDFDQRFYVCGPPEMVDDVSAALEKLGVDPDGLTFED